jgi:hypothetical protein
MTLGVVVAVTAVVEAVFVICMVLVELVVVLLPAAANIAMAALLSGPKYPVEGSPADACHCATAADVIAPKYPVGFAIAR